MLCGIDDGWAVVGRYMTIENREEEQVEPKALALRKHAALSGPDDAKYTTSTDGRRDLQFHGRDRLAHRSTWRMAALVRGC